MGMVTRLSTDVPRACIVGGGRQAQHLPRSCAPRRALRSKEKMATRERRERALAPCEAEMKQVGPWLEATLLEGVEARRRAAACQSRLGAARRCSRRIAWRRWVELPRGRGDVGSSCCAKVGCPGRSAASLISCSRGGIRMQRPAAISSSPPRLPLHPSHLLPAVMSCFTFLLDNS
jgi:hypothetical protein